MPFSVKLTIFLHTKPVQTKMTFCVNLLELIETVVILFNLRGDYASQTQNHFN